ncbi:Glucose-6-phosphate isomerase [Verticillium dahliae VDG1]|nr:Glucose-6-phosphate isomerase [Verticillium dahliae VDG1]
MSIPLSPKIPLWLDCDPGHDDTFAILLAAYHPAIRLMGISTVFGNAALDKTTMNAASILTSISKHNEIPVYAGASHALTRPPMHHPTDIHGESGLDGTDLLPQPLVKPNTTRPAVDAMAEAILAEAPNTVHVIATGAFTNVAALFQAHPNLKAHVKAVETDGSYADALEGKTQTGRTICRKLEAGSAGVAIPRGIDVPKFWKVLEECIQRADEANAGAVKGLAEKGPLHV